MKLRRVLGLIIGFVLVPAALLLTVGILILVFGSAARDYLFGGLILALVTTTVAGTAATLAVLHREARVARLQTDFVNKVSHDLRTPLTGIRMFADTLLLGRARDPESTRECLQSIQAETERLPGMIDRLLEWGKMEAGKRLYEPARHEVREIVDGALAALAPQLLETPAAVEVEVPPGLPRVSVDLDAMTEALLNLLQNAHKYSGEEKRIAVRCGQARREVTIAVADHGPGVPKAEHKRVFEKFYRGAESQHRAIPGTGLGLAIVEHIVRGHEGRVTLESEPGAGAIFTIHLPALGT